MSELPRVFIASSREALHIAEAVNIRLEHDTKAKLWDNAFDLSSLTLPALLGRTKEADFAIFVFHKDDKVVIRGNEFSSVRDNVLFELGLFIGALGIERCFVLFPKSVEGEFRLPTDLAGLTVAAYDDSLEDMVDAVTTCCAKIKQAIKKSILAETASQSAPVAKQDTTQILQSELWRARIDLQRANEQLSALHGAIAAHFHAIAKPATEKEIQHWEEGAKESYTNVPKIGNRNTFFVDRDLIIPSFTGASSLSVIVAPGVKIFGLDQPSHNTIYFLDGYRRMLGR